MNRNSIVRNGIISAIVLLVSACASTPTPEFVAADLNAETVGKLFVLPIVDQRIDQSKDLKLDKKLFAKRISRRVKKAHYDFTMEKNRATIASVTRDGLEDMDAKMISELGPADSRWVLLLVGLVARAP